MYKVLDACSVIRLIIIGLFDEVIDAYRGKLYISGSVRQEVSKEPSHSLLEAAIESGLVKVYVCKRGAVEKTYKRMRGAQIKIHWDDVPNIVAAEQLGAELITDDHVLFDAVHRYRHLVGRDLFVMNTRGILFELFLSKKIELVAFMRGILEIFKVSELPNIGMQLERHIIGLNDMQRLFGEYENYMMRAIQLERLGLR